MKIVFPVRFAAHNGAAVQTTSGEMTDSRMLLMCPPHRAPTSALVALQLYLPDSFPPAAAMGRVGAPAGKQKGDGFWLDVVDAVRGVAQRIDALLALFAPRVNRSSPDGRGTSPHRAAPRYPTSWPVTLGSESKVIAGCARNISTSGLYVHTEQQVPLGSLVAVRLALPDGDAPLAVQAKVIHRVTSAQAHTPWLEKGLGLQFVEGDDSFRSRLDRQLKLLQSVANSSPPRG
jgi:Tfp pilus assembly protein PilZ